MIVAVVPKVLIIEDDDDLAALLHQHPSALGLEARLPLGRRYVLALKQSLHQLFTTPTPLRAA